MENVIITNQRASGNTTRCIDAAIQDLFNNRAVTLNEKYYNTNLSICENKEFEQLVINRLKSEHSKVEYCSARNIDNHLVIRLS
jgi:hypothetical protein